MNVLFAGTVAAWTEACDGQPSFSFTTERIAMVDHLRHWVRHSFARALERMGTPTLVLCTEAGVPLDVSSSATLADVIATYPTLVSHNVLHVFYKLSLWEPGRDESALPPPLAPTAEDRAADGPTADDLAPYASDEPDDTDVVIAEDGDTDDAEDADAADPYFAQAMGAASLRRTLAVSRKIQKLEGPGGGVLPGTLSAMWSYPGRAHETIDFVGAKRFVCLVCDTPRAGGVRRIRQCAKSKALLQHLSSRKHWKAVRALRNQPVDDAEWVLFETGNPYVRSKV